MKNISYIFVILLALKLSTNCKKEPVIEPCSTTDNKETLNQDFELDWSEYDYRGFTCYGAINTPASVVYFIDPAGPGGDDIIALDKVNGDTIWSKPAQSSTSKHKLIGNTICYSRSGLICIDISTGSEVWRISNTSTKSLNDFIYANNKIYAFFDLGGGITGDSTNLYEIDPVTGNSVEKYTLYGKDRNGYNQSPRGMIFYKHPNGNEIIFAQSAGLNVSVGRGEYFAIDITGDSMYWDLQDFFNYAAIGFTPILNGNNIHIGVGFAGIASLNLVTKDTNWSISEPTASQTGGKHAVIADGKLFKDVGNFGHFNVLNLASGNQMRTYTGIGTNFRGSSLRLYNNKVYFTTTDVLGIVETSTGNMIQKLHYSEYVGGTSGGPQSGLDVDPTNGYIYTTRGFDFVCIKEK